MSNLDVLDFFRQADRARRLFYLDPPNLGSESDQGNQQFSRERFEDLAAALRGINERFILPLNDLTEIRETIAGFSFPQVKTCCSIGSQGTQVERTGALNSNWPSQP